MAYINFNPKEYFKTKAYTGTGAENAVTDIGFNPDFAWFKKTSTTEHHFVYDQVRGALKKLAPSNTNAEGTETQTLKSFDTGGYTLGTSAEVNGSGVTYVSYNWLAGGTGVSNTDGSITSTVSANTTSGFSIVTYTGTTNADIGHGLGGKPDLIIVKSRTSGAAPWLTWHSGLSGNDQDKYVYLDTTPAGTSANYWLGTNGITSTTFGVQNSGNDNNNGSMVAYCFRSIKGFSKFGKYTGNNNADGPFIYTGFSPSMIFIKNTTVNPEYWYLFDVTRDGYNGGNRDMVINGTGANPASGNRIDWFSNGFKPAQANSSVNDGNVFIYAAFAEHPLVSSTGTPCTAR